MNNEDGDDWAITTLTIFRCSHARTHTNAHKHSHIKKQLIRFSLLWAIHRVGHTHTFIYFIIYI